MAASIQLSQPELETSEILRGLRSRDPYDQYFAIIAIEETGRIELLPQLLPLFRSSFLDVKTAAIRVVGMLGVCDGAFYSATLMPMLADRSADSRYEAAAALGRLANWTAFEPLMELAESDANESVRKRAAQSARLVGEHPEPGDEVEEPRSVSFNPFRLAGL